MMRFSKHILIATVLIAAVVIVSGCGGPTGPGDPPTGEANVSGRVLDAATQAGLSGATVTMSLGGSATTDSTGNFTVQGANYGSQTLTITKSGYTSNSATVNVNTNNLNISAPFYLTTTTPSGGLTVTGKVVDHSNTSQGISGAIVKIATYTGTSDSNGNFSVHLDQNVVNPTFTVTPPTGYYPGIAYYGGTAVDSTKLPTPLPLVNGEDLGTIELYISSGPPPPPVY